MCGLRINPGAICHRCFRSVTNVSISYQIIFIKGRIFFVLAFSCDKIITCRRSGVQVFIAFISLQSNAQVFVSRTTDRNFVG